MERRYEIFRDLVTFGLWGRKGMNPAMVFGLGDWINDSAIRSANIY